MDAPYLYRSLVFGAVCGLYRLIEGFEKQEIDIEKVIAVGGISKKSPYGTASFCHPYGSGRGGYHRRADR